MNRVLKVIGITLTALVGLLILVFLVLKLIPDDKYKDWIVSLVESNTGREFSIETLNLDLNTSLQLNADDIRLANASWSETPDFLEITKAEAEVNLISLIKGTAEIRLILEGADIFAETSSDGLGNWEMGKSIDSEDSEKSTESSEFQGLPVRPLLREIRIIDSRLSFADGNRGTEDLFSIEDLVLETADQNLELTLNSTFNDAPISLSGNLGKFDEVIDKISSPMQLSGNINQASLSASGNWGPLLPSPNLDIEIELDVPSTKNLTSLTGIVIEEFGAVQAKAALTAADGQFKLTRMLTNLDGEAVKMSVTGSIENLTALDGIAISTEASSSSLDALLKQINLKLPIEIPPEVDLKAEISGGIENLGVKNFDAEIRDEGVSLRLRGTIENALSVQGIEATLTANVDSTKSLSNVSRLDLPDLGAVEISGDIRSEGERIRLENFDASLVSDSIKFRVSGLVEDIKSITGIDAEVTSEIAALSEQKLSEIRALLDQFNVALPVSKLPDSIKFRTEILGQLDALNLKGIDLDVNDPDIHLKVTGDVVDVLALQGVDAALKFDAESTAALSPYTNIELPDLGTATISGRIESKDDSIAVTELDAKLDGRNIELEVTGGMSDLLKLEGLDANVFLNISSISEELKTRLDDFLKQNKIEFSSDQLPAAAKLKTNLAGSMKELSVSDLEIEVTDPGMKLTVEGSVSDAINRAGVDALVTLNSDSLTAFSKYAKTELPELGPLNLTGKIKTNGEYLALESLTAKLDSEQFNVNLAAQIADLFTLNGIGAELDTQIDSLSGLSEFVEGDLPVTDPITITAKIESEGVSENEAATIAVNVQSAGAVVDLSGNLSDLKSAEDIEIRLEAKALSLSDFNKFVQTELPDVGPLNLSGTVIAKPDHYGLEKFKLTLDDQSVDGNVGINLAESDEDLSTVKGEVNIAYLDLSPYIIPSSDGPEAMEPTEQNESTQLETKEAREDSELEQAKAGEQEAPQSSDRLFSSDPLPLDQMRKIDVEFEVKGDRIKLGKTDLTDLDLALSLSNGLLKVSPLKALASPGTVDGEISLDARDDIAHLDLRLTLDDAPMPNMGGGLDFHLNLDGSGTSIAELMGGLNGQLLVVLRDGKIEQSFVTGVGSGLFSFSGGSDYTTLECGIFRTDIVDGIAKFDDKLAAQLTEVNWRGGGEINLKTEKLDVGVAPRPRTGLGIDVGVGNLASLIHVGGTLKNPRVQLNPKDVAMKYGKYMAALSTGGLSLLAEAVLNKSQADVDLCEKILTGTVFDEDAEVSDEATTEPGEDSESQTEEKSQPEDNQAKTQASETKTATQGSDSKKTKKKNAPVPKNLQ